MRVVRELGALPTELAAARAEAASAFGDGEVFVEPYVERGRHVEVQVLADAHGTVWTLGTRDCSLQRRHQKVIEEAPAPGLDDAARAGLADAARRAARAVGYRGAGTVEFLLAPDGAASFLEMNTRLQVEHPVTEEVHGVDLVALQLHVADGGALPAEAPPAHGHAVEARLYAEDPAHGWRPQSGVLHRLALPTDIPRLRVDSGVDPGATGGARIGVHYDPMLAKVVVWAPTRARALRALAAALERAEIHGLGTNRDVLVRSLRHPDVTDVGAGRLDTGFYARHLPELTRPAPVAHRALAALAATLSTAVDRRAGGGVAARIGGWRNLPSAPHTVRHRDETGDEHASAYRTTATGALIPDGDVTVREVTSGRVTLETGGVARHFTVNRYAGDDAVHVDSPLGSHVLTEVPRLPPPDGTAGAGPGALRAELPGTVVEVADGLAVGERVVAGQELLWLEAMKMRHAVRAPHAGVLAAAPPAPGTQVEVGTVLAVVAEAVVAEAVVAEAVLADEEAATPEEGRPA